jgi:DNA-binding MarR family transcriptional regulator
MEFARGDDVTNPQSRHAGHLLRIAQQVHTKIWNLEVSDEITSPQSQIIAVLGAQPNIDQVTATRLADLDRSTGAELIDRLAKKGLVVRHRDVDDRRRYMLSLTPKGEELLAALRPRTWELHSRILSMIPDEHRESFLVALESLVTNGRDYVETAEESDADGDAVESG